jgi:phosphate transport system substrate-binding protein
MKKHVVIGITALAALFAVSGYAQSINAAGATFPGPIYTKWFGEFKAANPGISINYQALGSGAGINQLTEGTVDFGASDMPMTDEQIAAVVKNGHPKPLHFPTVLGGIVMIYNIPGVSTGLKLTSDAVAGIYLGEIKKWNDPKITSANPGVKLPAEDIFVVHRAEGSGTVFVFTDYLSKVSSTWKSKVGANASVQWPVGLGAQKNDGVAAMVKQTPNSIGFVELIFAVNNKLAFADMKNAAGKFVTASFDSVTAAAAGSKDLAADFRGSITNAPGAGAWPISTYTWLLIPTEIKDAGKKKAITAFLDWMMTTGQKDAQGLSYAPLPKNIVDKEKKQVASIK